MSETVKLIIEIPKEDYEFTKDAETARVFPSEYYVKLILNGIPLDDYDELRETKNGGCYGEKFGLLQTLNLLMHPATLWPSQVLRLLLFKAYAL